MKRFILWAFTVLVPAVASAEPRFEVLDHGDSVEIIGHEITTARTNITAARSRLEIPLAAGALPAAKRVEMKNGDATVLLAEIDPDSHAVSIKLTMDHAGVVAIAKASQAMQIGDDVHVMVPRKAEGVVLPEPTLPVKVEIKPETAAVTPAKTETTTPAATMPMPLPSTLPTIATTTTPSAIPTKDKDAAPIAGAVESDSGTPALTYAGGGLLALAAGVWLWRRKKKPAAPQLAIDIIAQRSLGGKAKIVWLGAGGRELLVAVTPSNVRLLGDWARGQAPATAAIATATSTAPLASGSSQIPQITMPRTSTGTDIKSPAIDGILKLRQRTSPVVSETVATGDDEADSTWARELLAATVRR